MAYRTRGFALAVASLLLLAAPCAFAQVSGTFSVTVDDFAPNGNFVPLSVSTTSNNVGLPAGTTVVIYNLGTADAYVNFGGSGAVTATTSNDLVRAGQAIAFAPGTNTYVAAITTAGTTNLTLSGGNGLYTGVGGGGTSSVPTGTPGSPSTSVVTVQGVTSMTPLKVDGSGVTQPVSPVPATAGGLATYFVQPTASDNHANIKNGAGQIYHVAATNNSATINYVRFYNAAAGFNGCSSATNLVYQLAIPATTNGAGFVEDISQGLAFSSGISICVTSGYATNDTTNATASALSLMVGYK